MPPKMVGTILPTAADFADAERYARRVARDKARAAEALGLGQGRVVAGEVRYYSDELHYAIIGSDMELRRFEIRADGHEYAVRDGRRNP